MALIMATASGEMHGLINTLTNSVPINVENKMTEKEKKNIESERKEDARLVKAEYLNSRGKHERLTKPYCKYAGDPIQIWHFIPGKVYEVPLGLVKEVNDKNKVMKQRSGLVSLDDNNVRKDGAPLENDEEGDWLHKFSPVGF